MYPVWTSVARRRGRMTAAVTAVTTSKYAG
jgi:hypothetical protein